MKTTKNYSVQIQSDIWGHEVCSYATKKEAIARAIEVKRIGCFFTDTMPKSELANCTVTVYDSAKSEEIYNQPFKK